MSTSFRLGVVIVTYNSRDVIIDCLESLYSAQDKDALEIIVVDNASTDDTADIVAGWEREHARAKRGDLARPSLEVIRMGLNGGYAYGVNMGLQALVGRKEVGAFWVLNPDCVVPAYTPRLFLRFASAETFGLASSRCLFLEDKGVIQTDGGQFSRTTGVCHSLNARRKAAETPLPCETSLDYVSGANMLVSRAYISVVGYMAEDYFLYYEEVDWAHRRGNLPLRLIPGAEVYHKGGTSIGSGSLNTQPSAFSNYFNHRSRLRFVRKFLKHSYFLALGWTVMKSVQVAIKAGIPEALALLRGALNLPPPRQIRGQLPLMAYARSRARQVTSRSAALPDRNQ